MNLQSKREQRQTSSIDKKLNPVCGEALNFLMLSILLLGHLNLRALVKAKLN